MSNLVKIDHQENVLVLTLNRPERKNALSTVLLGELQGALTTQLKEDTLAIILHGAGGCFSAGGDFTELKGTIDDLVVDEAIAAVTSAIRAAPVPVIAAIDGPCMGGAFDLAMNCDVRIASTDARFQVPATRLGLLYSPVAIKRMHTLLGRDAVIQMLLMGKYLDAQAALDCGVVSQLIEGESCLEAAIDLAKSTSDNVRQAVEATKGLLNALDSDDYDPDHWEEIRLKLLASPERQAAVARARARVVK